MSTIVATPGARETATGRHRRDHFARLRVFGNRDAIERRPDFHVDEIGAPLTDDAFGDADLLIRDRDSGPQRFNFSARGIQLRLADDLFLDELLAAAECQLRLAQSGFVLRGTAARRLELRLADGE